MGVTRGPDVEGAPTRASRQCSSHSLIFLIASTPHRVSLKSGIRGRLVLLWFSASSRKRPSGAGVSTFVVFPCLLKLHLLLVGEYEKHYCPHFVVYSPCVVLVLGYICLISLYLEYLRVWGGWERNRACLGIFPLS